MKSNKIKNIILLISISISVDVLCQLPANGKLKITIPDNFTVLDSASGDLNQDGYRDYIVILKNVFEEMNGDTTRPLLIFFGNKKQQLALIARNEHVVLCRECGGVFGDPYEGISINGKYFSIDHYGGSGWRWTRNITFKYDKLKKMFLLHSDGGISFQSSKPDKPTKFFQQKKDFNKLPFEKYTYDN